MSIAHGSLAGLPEFVEIIQMILIFVRRPSASYWEYYRVHELKMCPRKEVELTKLTQTNWQIYIHWLTTQLRECG